MILSYLMWVRNFEFSVGLLQPWNELSLLIYNSFSLISQAFNHNTNHTNRAFHKKLCVSLITMGLCSLFAIVWLAKRAEIWEKFFREFFERKTVSPDEIENEMKFRDRSIVHRCSFALACWVTRWKRSQKKENKVFHVKIHLNMSTWNLKLTEVWEKELK